ncbi:MAG: hypothetical protein M4579_007001 [Chaenotheca gracillima]|nr:MAG: hypothetical protein M4579_007001 [Chaenotheca gracillima]
MDISDTVLSLDLGPKDSLYRIRRDEANISRVIYVTADLSIIPEDRRTYGPWVLQELRKLQRWNDIWDTLTVCKDGSKIQCYPDQWKPHRLPQQQILSLYECFNILDLRVMQSIKDRVFRVALGSKSCFLKIARFPHEMLWLRQEIKIYHALMDFHSTLAPAFLGYAFEERYCRVTGFLFEEVHGRFADIVDLQTCEDALHRLHALDIIHGDVNRYNIIVTTNGPTFIDFEDSRIGPNGSLEEWEGQKAEEMQNLSSKLLDESGKGRPWTFETLEISPPSVSLSSHT